jgi:hypothetical protein
VRRPVTRVWHNTQASSDGGLGVGSDHDDEMDEEERNNKFKSHTDLLNAAQDKLKVRGCSLCARATGSPASIRTLIEFSSMGRGRSLVCGRASLFQTRCTGARQ